MSKDMLGIAVRKLVTLPGETLGVVCDLLEKTADPEWVRATKKFLRKENPWDVAARPWREENGVIYFSVTSDGTTGEEWIARLEAKGFRVGDYAKNVLRSPDFRPTVGVTTEIAVLKGLLFEDRDRVTKKIRAFAARRHLTSPNAEVACLIREKFTDKELEAMGLWWIVTMHEPTKDSGGDPYLLDVGRSDDGSWLGASWDDPDDRWNRGDGFAFAVSQAQHQAGAGQASA